MTLKMKNLFFMVANTCNHEIKISENDKQISLMKIYNALSVKCTMCEKDLICNRLLNDLLDTYEKEQNQKQEIEVIV